MCSISNSSCDNFIVAKNKNKMFTFQGKTFLLSNGIPRKLAGPLYRSACAVSPLTLTNIQQRTAAASKPQPPPSPPPLLLLLSTPPRFSSCRLISRTRVQSHKLFTLSNHTPPTITPSYPQSPTPDHFTSPPKNFGRRILLPGGYIYCTPPLPPPALPASPVRQIISGDRYTQYHSLSNCHSRSHNETDKNTVTTLFLLLGQRSLVNGEYSIIIGM